MQNIGDILAGIGTLLAGIAALLAVLMRKPPEDK